MKDASRLRLVKWIAKLIYPNHNFKDHILVTVAIARMLALKLGADLVTVEVASYLHDIGRVLLGYKDHGRKGSFISKLILLLLRFDQKKKRSISYCVLVHDGNNGEINNLEAEIVANADALSQIDNFLYLFSIYYSSHGKDTLRVKKWIREKYYKEMKRKITLPIARSIAKKKLRIIDEVLQWPNTTCSGLNSQKNDKSEV